MDELESKSETIFLHGVRVTVEVPDVINRITKLPASHFRHGSWECGASITGMCVYTDYMYEDCIFCGQPEERK